MLKKNILLISLLYSISLAGLSLIKLEDVPDYVPSFSDKIFHFLAYALLTIFWYFALVFHFKLKNTTSLILAAIASITFGIIIEVLQGEITETRAADLNDVFANLLGVIIAVILLILKNKFEVKNL